MWIWRRQNLWLEETGTDLGARSMAGEEPLQLGRPPANTHPPLPTQPIPRSMGTQTGQGTVHQKALLALLGMRPAQRSHSGGHTQPTQQATGEKRAHVQMHEVILWHLGMTGTKSRPMVGTE